MDNTDIIYERYFQHPDMHDMDETNEFDLLLNAEGLKIENVGRFEWTHLQEFLDIAVRRGWLR